MKKRISIYISFYICIILFYGILIKLTFNKPAIYSICKYTPEMILFLIILECILCRIKYKIKRCNNLYLLLYMTFIMCIGLIRRPNIESILYVTRDMYLPVITLFCLSNINFSNEEMNELYLKLIKIFMAFIVCGSLLAIIQQHLGWEWTSSFFTGNKFYGVDPVSKIKIWQYNGVLRVPGLTGNSVTFAFYNLIGVIIIYFSDKKKSIKIILFLLSLISIIMSNNKTILLILVFLIVINLLSQINKYLRLAGIFSVSIVFFCGIAYLVLDKVNLLSSLQERLIYWKSLMNFNDAINCICPTNIYLFTSESKGVYSFLDSTYLFFILGTGFIGLILVIRTIKMSLNRINNRFFPVFKNLAIYFFMAGITTNFTQGRAFFTIYMIFIGYFCFNDNSCLEESV